MIKIEDDDLPIEAARKIITGTKPNGHFTEILGTEKDMFSLEEIGEIAGYLQVYYDSHKNTRWEV